MNFIEVVKKNLRFLILVPLIIAGLVFAGSLFQTRMYKSTMSLMVVQKQGEEVDALAAVKSAEALADILTRVTASESFRSSVLSNIKLDQELSNRPWKRAKQWQKIVKARNITDTGILIIDTYQPTSKTATQLAASIEDTLIKQGYNYLGVSPDFVNITRLNPPAPTDDAPATPNIALNTIVAWLIGMILAISLLLLFPEKNLGRIFGGGGRKPKYVSVPTKEPVTSESPAMASGLPAQSGMLYSENLTRQIIGEKQEAQQDEQPGPEPDQPAEEPSAPTAGQPPINLPTSDASKNKVGFVSEANNFLRKF